MKVEGKGEHAGVARLDALRRRSGGNGEGIAWGAGYDGNYAAVNKARSGEPCREGAVSVRGIDGAMMKPPVGAYVMDTRSGRVGVVMGHEGPYIQLRPYGGGREWDAEPGAVRHATPAERLSAATAYANARSRGEVP